MCTNPGRHGQCNPSALHLACTSNHLHWSHLVALSVALSGACSKRSLYDGIWSNSLW